LRGNLDGPVLELGGDQDTSVSGVTIEPMGAATSALRLLGTSARGVDVKPGSAQSLTAGVEFFGDSSFDAGEVHVDTVGYALLAYSGAGTVTGSTLSAPNGAGLASGASELTVSRSTLDGQYGALAQDGHVTLSDAVVDLRGKATPSIGVYAEATSAGAR